MRVSKKYDVRLTEILDAAEALFSQIGYEKTTINNILEKVGIGKGTFYHYFQSKEELGEAVVARIVDYIAASVDVARSKPAINAHEKMIATLYALRINENPHTESIIAMGNPYNAFLHQKALIKVVGDIAPMMAAIAEEGIAEGFYKSEYPLEIFEVSLAAIQTIYNWNIMNKTYTELFLRMTAIVHLMELSLGAPEGSFGILLENIPTGKECQDG